MAQLGHTVGIVKSGGGTNTWKRPLLPSGQLSRLGRLGKALGHHSALGMIHSSVCSYNFPTAGALGMRIKISMCSYNFLTAGALGMIHSSVCSYNFPTAGALGMRIQSSMCSYDTDVWSTMYENTERCVQSFDLLTVGHQV